MKDMKLYAKITRYEVIRKQFCGKDVGIHKNIGSYIQPLDKIINAIDFEFDSLDDIKKGQKVTIEIIEMPDGYYEFPLELQEY